MRLFVKALVLFVLTHVVNGFALSKMWFWFVSDVFDLPKLSVASAIGLSLLLSVLRGEQLTLPPVDDRQMEKIATDIALRQVAFAGFSMVCGWALHRYFM